MQESRTDNAVQEVITASNATDGHALIWEVRLGDRDPQRRWVVLGVAILTGVAGWLLFHQAIFAIFGFVAILASTTEVLFPTRYRIDSNGARAKCGISVTSIEWANVKRIGSNEAGVHLSPFAKPSRLDAFRGVYLRFAGNRDEVLAKMRQFTDADE